MGNTCVQIHFLLPMPEIKYLKVKYYIIREILMIYTEIYTFYNTAFKCACVTSAEKFVHMKSLQILIVMLDADSFSQWK